MLLNHSLLTFLTGWGGQKWVFSNFALKIIFIMNFVSCSLKDIYLTLSDMFKKPEKSKVTEVNFFQKVMIFDIFANFLSFLQNGWLLTPVDYGTKCLACWNRFIIVRVTIWKKHSKQRYSRKIVNKNRKNMEFWCALSSHLITIDMCCKGQWADQVVAIGCRFIKTRKNFNFFKKI